MQNREYMTFIFNKQIIDTSFIQPDANSIIRCIAGSLQFIACVNKINDSFYL